MTREQLGGQRGEVAALRGVAPPPDRRLAMDRDEVIEARRKRIGRGEEVRVLRHQQRDAQRLRRIDANHSLEGLFGALAVLTARYVAVVLMR